MMPSNELEVGLGTPGIGPISFMYYYYTVKDEQDKKNRTKQCPR